MLKDVIQLSGFVLVIVICGHANVSIICCSDDSGIRMPFCTFGKRANTRPSSVKDFCGFDDVE